MRTPIAHDTCQHRVYRLTCNDYEQLLSRAGGACEICGVAAEHVHGGKLYIDHDSRIGWHAVRGLVCSKCNAHLRRIDTGERPVDDRTAAYLGLSGLYSADGTPLPPRPRARGGRRGSARTGTGATRHRVIRVPDETWGAVLLEASEVGTSAGELARQFYDWWLHKPGAKMPKRPPPTT